MQQNKVKKKVLMAPQKTKDLLNKSFEKCFEELSEGLDMGKFMSNIKTLANNEREKQQEQSIQNLDKKENVFKQEQFESIQTEPLIEQPIEFDSTKKLKPIKKKREKSREEKFQQKLKNFNNKIERILNEKVNSRKKKPKRCNSQFYERMKDYQQKHQQKIEEIRKVKQMETMNQFSFQPKINKPQKSKDKFNFLQKMLLRSQEKKLRDNERKKNYDEYQKEIFQKSCTFKPKINKSHSHSKRNVKDLILWKQQIEKKREDQKEFFQEKFSFIPKITKKSKQILSQKQNQFSNPGERLYREFLTKKQANSRSIMQELKMEYESEPQQNNKQQHSRSKSLQKNQLAIIKQKMNKKKSKFKKNRKLKK